MCAWRGTSDRPSGDHPRDATHLERPQLLRPLAHTLQQLIVRLVSRQDVHTALDLVQRVSQGVLLRAQGRWRGESPGKERLQNLLGLRAEGDAMGEGKSGVFS